MAPQQEREANAAVQVLATMLRAFVQFMMLPVMLAQILVRVVRRR